MATYPLPEHLRLPNNEDPHKFAARLTDLANMHPGHGFAWYFAAAAELITRLAPPEKAWAALHGGYRPEPEGRIPEPLDVREVAGAFWRPFSDPMPQNLPIEVKTHTKTTSRSNTRDYAAAWWINQGYIGWRPDAIAQAAKAGSRNKMIKDRLLPGDHPQTRMTPVEAEAMAVPKRKPVIMFNGEPIPTAAGKKKGRVLLAAPDKPISEAPAASKRGRVALIAPKPEKPLAGRKSGFFDDEEE